MRRQLTSPFLNSSHHDAAAGRVKRATRGIQQVHSLGSVEDCNSVNCHPAVDLCSGLTESETTGLDSE